MPHEQGPAAGEYASIRVLRPAWRAVTLAKLDIAAHVRRELTNTAVVLALVAVAMRHLDEVAAELARGGPG